MPRERRPRGVKHYPFYALLLSYEKSGHVRLDPHPWLADDSYGPRFVLKDMLPFFDGKLGSFTPLTGLLYFPREDGVKRADVIKLAEELEERVGLSHLDDYLNASLILSPVMDERLNLSAEDRKKRFPGASYEILPVHFFHVEVEVPKEIRYHKRLLEELGI